MELAEAGNLPLPTPASLSTDYSKYNSDKQAGTLQVTRVLAD